MLTSLYRLLFCFSHLKALTINGLHTTITFLHAFLVLVREPLAPVLTLVVLGSLLFVISVVGKAVQGRRG